MSFSQQTTDLLEAMARVLLRSTILGFGFVLLWVVTYLTAHDFMLRTQGTMFELTTHEIALVHYCGIALVKGLVILFFLFPYIAIRWVLRGAKA